LNPRRWGKQSEKIWDRHPYQLWFLSSVIDYYHGEESMMTRRERYFILEAWSRIILLLDDMIKNSLASVVCESSCDVASFLLLEFRLYEFGCDATSFFLRSDDRLKLGRKDLAFRVWRIENRNMCLARQKTSEFIDEIWQGIGASDACDDACDDKKNKK